VQLDVPEAKPEYWQAQGLPRIEAVKLARHFDLRPKQSLKSMVVRAMVS
jgi:hypothetical protein